MKKQFLILKSLVLLVAFILPAAARAASADLSIPTHSHSPNPPTQLSGVSWYFTVHNDGPDTASNVTVTVSTTGPQVYQGSASPYPFIDNGDGTYTATIGSVSVGSDVTFRISFGVTAGGAISATAVVSSPDDGNASNNSATDTATATGSPTADLEMTMVTVSPNPGQVGDLRTYQGTLTNLGPDEATNVAIGIQADSQDQQGFGYDAYETFDHSIPAPSSPNPDPNGFRYLPVGNIPSGGTVTFYAFYRAVQEGSFHRSFFTDESGEQVDPNQNNNSISVFSTIGAAQGAQADLDPTVQAPTKTTVGSNITYTFNTFNLGPDTATNVVTSFKPSVNEKFVSASVPYTLENTGPSAGYYYVNNGDLPLHVGDTFTFVFKATKAGPITLTGGAFSDTYDPNGTNDNFDVTTTATAAPTPPPPAHGGLTATSFTVDGSRDATSGVADTVLRFAAAQLGTPADLTVRVQYTTAPGDHDAIWEYLNNGDGGLMTYDPVSQQFLLSSLNYPTAKTVAFRAVSSASGYPDSISNVVGNFNLSSTKPRLDSPALALTGNGPFADLYFRTYSDKIISGTTERIQETTTPYDEDSWGDLRNGNGGAMQATNDPKRFYLMVNQIPAGKNVFFRVIASHKNYADGISQPNGPYDLTSDTPPTITSLTISPKGSGSGKDFDHPIILSAGPVTISATVKPATGHTIKTLKLLIDGDTRFTVDNKSTVQYVTGSLSIGDHVIEAVGVDDMKAQARLGTNPTYLRITPPTGSAVKAEHATGGATTKSLVVGKTYYVAKSGGVWTDPTTWKDILGKPGVPGPDDFAVVGSSSIRFGFDGDVGSVSINGGHLIGGAVLNIEKQITISAASIDGPMTIRIKAGAVCELVNPSDVHFNPEAGTGFTGNILNDGSVNVHGGAGLVGLSSITNLGTVHLQVPLDIPALAGKLPALDNRAVNTDVLRGSGMVISDLIPLIGQDGNGLIGQDGNGLIGQDGNGLVGPSGGTLVNTNGSNIVGQGGGNLVNTNGSNIVAQGGGNIVAQGGGNHQSAEHAEVAASGLIQTGGEIDLSGINIIGNVTLDGGILAGSGVIYGNLTNTSGYILPGHSPGVLAVRGNFTQGSDGTMVMEDGGATPNKFDQLQVSGTANLGGTLDLKLINGYVPDKVDSFSPLSYSTHNGKFASVSGNATAAIKGTGVLITVNHALPAPSSGATANISSRAQVLTGDDVMIGGFIVSGPAGSTKKVIMRGIGPSLAAVGIQGALSDPYLELHSGAAILAKNDNWKENQTAVMKTGLAPAIDSESAIVENLAPGSYTVILRGAHSETGVGLVEIYDLDPGSTAQLGNISTRCKVGTEEDVMIGGFILSGTEPAKVLVRAIGPSLAAVGVRGALADPVLELHDANGAAITNNDWQETQRAAISATALAPSNAKESAILMTLPPGQYTAIVRGNDEVTGVGLVEVYNLK